jgi:ribonuclease HII
MTIWVGIDEAGYGPNLGPLCLGLMALKGTSWRDDFWTDVSDFACLEPQKWREKLVICDSKKLYRSGKGLQPLETSTLALTGRGGTELGDWLRDQGDFDLHESDRYPWYADPLTLPLEASVARIDEFHDCWREGLLAQGVTCGMSWVRPILTRRFNSLLRRYNKSALETHAVLMMVQRVLESFPGEAIQIEVDKLGGRDHYGDLLAHHFPLEEIVVVGEGRTLSHYCLPGRQMEIRFRKGGERDSLVIAAASLLAKYCREALMVKFNRWWCARVQGLTPTAGYPQDAARWMEAARPHLLAEGYTPDWIWRNK